MMKTNKPESGKQYRLTGPRGVASIAAGNSWKESEVTPEPPAPRPVCPNCGQWADSGDCFNECVKRGFASER